MKVGDKVRVIRVISVDKEETALSIGDTGIIIRDYNNSEDDPAVYGVGFDDSSKIPEDAGNLINGGYDMFDYQLEVIEAAP